MRRLFQYPALRGDIATALRYTDRIWGKRKKEEYKVLINEAKAALRENPFIATLRPDIHPEARAWRIAKPGRDATHVFLYVVTSDENVILVRFLHERRDLPRHFPSDYERGAR
jgi:plasmid stabilization system protein ParE